ncbi:MAG: C4-dicarboxylate ABC transporter, partial [Desulfitobacterium sp.]|nr:C4-dicarboxylate ABC transporter [Desulfitobacterium sp.]
MMNSKNYTLLRSVLCFTLGLIYLSNWLFESPLLEALIFPLLIIVILLSFPVTTGSSRVIGTLSFVVSILLLLEAQAPLEIWEKGLKTNLFLVVMFIMVPLLGIPIQEGGYTGALQGLFDKKVNTQKKYYLLVSLLTSLVGVLVNLAVVPLVNQICRNSKFSTDQKLLGSAIIRGFSACAAWAPTAAGIGYILQIAGSDWVEFFPMAIISAALMGFAGYIITICQGRDPKEGASITELNDIPKYSLAKVVELGIFASVLLGSIVLISYFTGITAIVVVSMMALIYPLVWMLIIKKVPLFFREVKEGYFHHRLPSVKNELFLFLGAGLLATSINYSHYGDYVPLILNSIVGESPLLLTLFVIISVIFFAGLGIHPIVTVTIIGGTVNIASYGLSELYFAVLLAASWSLGASISPSSGTVITVSGMLQESPLKVG